MWVPQTRHMSCDVLVFVKESAEPVVSSDVGGVGVGLAMFDDAGRDLSKLGPRACPVSRHAATTRWSR